MARETELGFKIKRVLSNNDEWKKIVNETEEFYKKVENNPLKISIGDVKHAVVGLQKVQQEIDKIRTDANSNNGMLDFAKTLETVTSNAEDKFSSIGVMFKNVNNNTRKYVTGLSNITRYLGDSNFGVGFLDVGARFGELQNRAEELFDTLKAIGTFDGEFSFWNGSFNKDDLRERIDVLRELKSVQEEMTDYDSSLRAGDFLTGQNVSGLNRWIEDAQKSLELLRQSGLETTEELSRLREEFTDKLYGYSWDDDSFKRAKENINDKEFYESSLQSLRDYINGREELLKSLDTGYERNLFSDDELDDMRRSLENSLTNTKGQLKELEQLKNIGQNIDFTEVINVLNEIKNAIKEIRNEFEPLTTALATEGTAFQKMATEGGASLDSLVEKLKELNDLVDVINKKEFKITQNIFNKDGVSGPSKTSLLQEEAQALYKQVELLKKDAYEIYDIFNKRGLNRNKLLEITSTLGQLEEEDFSKKVNTRNASALESAIGKLKTAKQELIQFNELINQTDIAKWRPDYLNASSGAQSTNNAPSTGRIVDKIKSEHNQIEEELKAIRQQIESTFDFSTVDPKYENIQAITDKIYQQFVELQAKIKALDFNITVPATITDTIKNESKKANAGAEDSSKVINTEAQAMSEVSARANEAAVAKEKFANANREVKTSAETSVASLKEEASTAKEVATSVQSAANKLEVSQDEIIKKYKEVFGGTDKVKSTLAEQFNKVLRDANVDASSITASFAQKSETVGKGDDKQVFTFDTIKLVAQYTDELGKANTITREYIVSNGALIKQMGSFKEVKDAFDLSNAKEKATSQLAELQKRMGSFKIDITGVQEALGNITDESSFKVFQNELDAANQKIKEIKASIKSSRSLDPIVNAESMMSNLETTIATYRENIKQLSNVEGYDKLESSLDAIITKLKEFEANQAFGGDGKDMASIVADINKEITTYNANLKLVTARYQENTRAANEYVKAEKQRIAEENAAEKKTAQKNKLELDINRQTGLLTKQQALWEKNGQLTDELRLNIELMFEALTEVTNSSELSAWKKQWAIVKDEVMATKYQIEAANKAQKEANNDTATERKVSSAYWDSAFKESLNNLITPQKRPELEQLKAYMLSQAESTKESVIEQYDAIMTIISSKNVALQKLMAAKGPSEKPYWQDEYSAWFGAWNNLDQNVVSNFFKDAGNQAILGKDKVEAFNNELEKSTQLANKQKDAEFNKQAKEQEKINKKNQNYGKTEYNKYAKFYETMNATIRNIEQNGSINQYLDSLVQKYTEAYKKIEAMRKQFAENPDAANDIGLKNDFQDAVVEAEKLRKEITGVFKEAKKFDQIEPLEISTLEKYDLDDIRSSLVAFANEVTNGKVKLEGFNDAGTQLYGTFDNGSGSVEKVTFALREGTNQLYAYSAATGKAANEWEDFKAKAVAGAKNLIGMYVGFQEGVQAFRTGVNYVKEIDLAMTELKKVTDETDASYKQFLKDAASASSVIGSTISDFTEASANFARLGYSMEEAASMAETAIIYKNVADGLDTVEESTESIISTMKAFGIESSDTMSIIDKFNAVGNSFAITSAGIGEALQRSASALYAAGNTLDESVALVTAANSVWIS